MKRGFFVSFIARLERNEIRTTLSRGKVGFRGASSGPWDAAQFTRVQVCPPQNMPPNAQPWTRNVSGPFIAIMES